MRCKRKLQDISYKEKINNEEVVRMIQAGIDKYCKPLTLVRKQKLQWFGTYHDLLA